MKKSLMQVQHDLRASADRIAKYDNFLQSLIMISVWVIHSYEAPDESPQTLGYQIKQLKRLLDKGA